MSDPAAPAPAPKTDVPRPAASDATPLETIFKGNRPLAAAALLLLIEAVPAAGLIVALREDGGVWMVFASVLLAGGLLPPLGVLLGQKWGYVLGQYVTWGSLVGVVLRVLHGGFSPVYLVPAMLLGVLLVALSPPRSSGGGSRAEKKPESFGVWLKENLEAIIIAFIMALVIRCFCIEVFKIPSSSMEPTLLGDISSTHGRDNCTFRDYHVSPGGDRIMVTKYFYNFSSVERYDVLVFKFPLNTAKNFIKRVVGLPGEWLMIHRGNLYTSKTKDGPFQIARRTPRTQDSIWINPAKGTEGWLQRKEDFGRDWDSEKPEGAKGRADHVVKEGELSTQEKDGERSTRFVYKPRHLEDGSGAPVDDVRIAFEFEMTSSQGQVFAEVANAYGRFEAVLDSQGSSWLNYQTAGGDNGKLDIKNVQLTQDRRFKLELAIFDGMAYVRVNDGERARHPFITEMRKDKDSGRNFVPVTENPDRRIAFGARGATFRVRNLALGRDIYYRGKSEFNKLHDDEPFEVKPDTYLMMGDNVANSHDSRAWVKRTFRLKNGRDIVCESQQVNSDYKLTQRLKEKLGLTEDPPYTIDGDKDGNEVAITSAEFERELEPEPFRLVERKYVVGKALWIWWPQGRWFHLIR